jgi:hypothetical protein
LLDGCGPSGLLYRKVYSYEYIYNL